MKRFSLPMNKTQPSREELFGLYMTQKKSVKYISDVLKCSQNKVNYWLQKYEIQKRSISDAMYELKNPDGDPFIFTQPKTKEDAMLFGLGLGLYWGEGAKRGTGGVRLTNTDPRLLKKFIEFLEKMYMIDRDKLRFSIQIFRDISSEQALAYWCKELDVSKDQFYKVIVSKVRGLGTYRHKSEHGVVIVYFNNIKLKQSICSLIENIR